MKPTLHLLGLFHTITNLSFSHCAFTGKVLRFPKMMQQYGYNVIEYSNEGSISNASEQVDILSTDEFNSFFNDNNKFNFHGDSAIIGGPVHSAFENKLINELSKRVKNNDIICHPFSFAHESLLQILPNAKHIETGIGYPAIMKNAFHIYESYAWRHYHLGLAQSNGNNLEWVVPNYFDVDDWQPNYNTGSYIAFMGRITAIKGLDTILEIANIINIPIKIAGQGDPSNWSHANIEYIGPITGKERSDFLGNALCTLMPTVYVEPFGGVAIESMLCGTPVISVDYGAFSETIEEGINGYRCHTIEDWINGILNSFKLDRKLISDKAREKYNLLVCGEKYHKIFTVLSNKKY